MAFPLAKAFFVALVFEALLHGIYTVLFGGALYLLLATRQRQTARTSPINITMIVLTVIMYSLSTTHLALSMHQNLIAFFDQHAADGVPSILNDQNTPLLYTQIAIEVINCLIGDSIVCWRTWVLWGRDKKVILAPAICILAAVPSSIGLVIAFARSPPGQDAYSPSIMRWFIAFGTLTFLANLYAVVAIAFKAWRTVRILRQSGSGVTLHTGKYHNALLMVIESGLLYCIALIVTITLFILGNNGVYIITDILGHLTGIYPTAIIVLVCLNLTFHDEVTRTENVVSTMRCEPGRRNVLSTTVGQSSFGGVMHFRRGGGGLLSENENELGLQRVDELKPYVHSDWGQSKSTTAVTSSSTSTSTKPGELV